VKEGPYLGQSEGPLLKGRMSETKVVRKAQFSTYSYFSSIFIKRPNDHTRSARSKDQLHRFRTGDNKVVNHATLNSCNRQRLGSGRLVPTIKRIAELLFCILLSSLPVVGQTPKTAGSRPMVDVSLGYSYVDLGLQPSRANLNGLDATINTSFRSRFGVTLDLGYVRGSDVNGSTRHADVLSYLAGPSFYLTRKEGLSTYAHVLGGGARVTGAVPGPRGFTRGYINQPALALGGGVEVRISRSLAARLGGDYVRASYLTSSTAFHGQNDFRAVASIVYFFGSLGLDPPSPR
jgi:opacity protein-like surface antigen